MIKRLEHFPNLPFFALVDDNFDQRLVFVLFQHSNDRGTSSAAINFYTLFKAPEFLRGRGTYNQGLIGFFHFKAGMEYGVAQFTIVGHEQCAFGVKIKPPDRKEAQWNPVDEIGDNRPALGIGKSGDVTGRFVEENIAFLFKDDRFSVTGDSVVRRVGLASHLHDNLTIDPNPPVTD